MSGIPAIASFNLRGEILPVGWALPEGLSEAEWQEAGLALGRIERNVSWWIGEWWAYGEARYGQRKAVVESPDWDGPTYDSCRVAARVARRFPRDQREVDLTFGHHQEVASLPDDQARPLLRWAAETVAATGRPRSTRELRAAVSRCRVTIGEQPSSETCTLSDLDALVDTGARFGCIYADPPWLYDNQATRASTGNHYSGLTVDQLCDMPIRALSADDAHLHMWTTNAFLFECPRILAAWGFEFRSTLIWVKRQMGIGNYWRNSHEILVTAIRGNATRFNNHSMMSWLECDRGAHSAKPEQVRGMVEKASPGPYLELFGRRQAEGWTVFGNQISRDLFLASRLAA